MRPWHLARPSGGRPVRMAATPICGPQRRREELMICAALGPRRCSPCRARPKNVAGVPRPGCGTSRAAFIKREIERPGMQGEWGAGAARQVRGANRSKAQRQAGAGRGGQHVPASLSDDGPGMRLDGLRLCPAERWCLRSQPLCQTGTPAKIVTPKLLSIFNKQDFAAIRAVSYAP